MMKKTPRNPMPEALKAIMPKATDIMAAATIDETEMFTDQLFQRVMHAAIVTAVTGIETPLTVTPKIEDGVITGFEMHVAGEAINEVPAEEILSKIMKTVIFFANKHHEQKKMPDFPADISEILGELFGHGEDDMSEVDTDELAEESASGDDVSVNTEPATEDDGTKPEPSEQQVSP